MKLAIRALATVVALLIVLPSANAEIMVAPTLDWIADHCPDSGLYKVVSVNPKTQAVSYKLHKVLRGDPPKTLEHVVGSKGVPKPADDFLVAFQRYEDGTTRRPLQVINLTKPATRGFSSVAITSRLDVLTDKKSILKTFRARLKRKPKVDPVLVGDYSKDRFELDYNTPAHSAIYGGSSCYLLIPADLVKMAKAAAKRHSKKAAAGLTSAQP